MNGKACKRVRLATRFSPKGYDQLKKEYKVLPYHRRDKPKESHSFHIRKYHTERKHT